jgi:cation transport protein ChaC
MLTRKAIDSGAYLRHFESQPNLWSLERIDASLAEILKQRPPEAHDTWIFGYGSLIWNPMIEFETMRPALLHDWHRSFCVHMVSGRGSPTQPGRMLAVEPGSHTWGVALRLSPSTVDRELKLIWIREMVLGSYKPIWAPVTLFGGTRVQAIVFAADEHSKQYQADSSLETIEPLIRSANGEFGSNAGYVHKLRSSLRALGLRDTFIDQLSTRLRSPTDTRLPGDAAAA